MKRLLLLLVVVLAAALPLCLAQPTITTACPLPSGTVGVPYSQTFTATGGMPPYFWSIVESNPPPGLSLTSSTGVLSGTPTATGTYNFIIRVADYLQRSATKACAITVNPGLTITTACPLPSGTVGVPYSQTFTATGGMPPYFWSIVESNPPPGLSLTSSTGVLSGTPTATGTYNFIIRVADSYGQQSATKPCSVTFVSALAISSISPPSTMAGCGGVLLTIFGTGFVSAAIGGGASMVEFSSPATGARTLQPSSITSTQIQVSIPESLLLYPGAASIRVVNPGGVYSNAVSFTIAPGPTITLIDPVWATVGSAGLSLTVRGSGFVPPGATSGSLVQFVTPGGAASTLETLFVTDTELRAQVPPSLLAVAGLAQVAVISPPCSLRSNLFPFEILEPLRIVNTSLPDGVVGASYSATLQAAGGKPSYSFSVTGTLPEGLRFTSSTGVISGTPARAGVFPLLVGVRDSVNNTASRELSLTVISGLAISTGSPLPNATAGVAYSQSLTATGGTPPYSWTAVGLPSWLNLNASTGALSGTPSAAGAFEFTVRVTDSAQSAVSKSFALTVLPGLAIVTASPLPAATASVAYGQVLSATGGTPPYTWSATGLPGWLTLNASTGALTGIPSAPATHEFTIRVTDSVRSTATKVFGLTVNPGVAPLTITTASPLPEGIAGIPYSQTLAASGGTPPYRWSVSSGALPRALSLNAATGVISGTPAAAGSASFTVQVSDNAQRTATQAFVLTISPVPAAQYSGLSATVQPGQQPRLQLNLAAAVSAPISGTLTLSFSPDAVNPIDNPEVVFANGQRRVDFTIPAGQTRALFGTAQEMGIQVGTVAGTITVAAAPLTGTVVARVERRAPTISSVRVTRTSSGFDIEIIGYATPRSVTSAAFTFTASGADLQTPTVTVNVDSAFTTWYRNSASNAFGSQFRYVQPFTVTGQASAVTSVSVTLTNASGTSSAVSANF